MKYNSPNVAGVILMILGVVAVWGVVPWALVSAFSGLDWQGRGQLGDIFGSVNALFSGLAFLGLILSIDRQQAQIRLQAEQLAIQQEELRLQREEMRASRKELANQARAQYALVEATAAQITVAAVQAKIEHAKLRADSAGPAGRQAALMDIAAAAVRLEKLADSLPQLYVPHGEGAEAADAATQAESPLAAP